MTPLLLITATGNRQTCFDLCEKWVAAQTYKGPYLWLVVDDGDEPTATTMGQTVIRRARQPKEPPHTLALNMREALPHIRDAERVLFVEDDDAYGPRYVETMMGWMDAAPLVGEVGAKYYHVGQRAYRHFTEHKHASLCRTGMVTAQALPTFEKALTWCIARRTPMIDMKMWGYWGGKSFKFKDKTGDARLCVGIKGMPGRVSNNHNRADYIPDPDLSRLKLWVGEGYAAYLPFLGPVTPPPPPPVRFSVRVPLRMPQPPEPAEPLVVYTAIFGGYDKLKPARSARGARYVCFTDRPGPPSRLGWEMAHMAAPDPVERTRYVKMHPHLLFPDATQSLWIDGSMELRVSPYRVASAAGDAELYLTRHHERRCIVEEAAACVRTGRSGPLALEQARSYIDAGHSELWGLYCGGMIYRRHTEAVKRFNEAWWAEFLKWHARGTSRDQISLAPVMRTSGVKFGWFDKHARGRFVYLRHHAVIPASRMAVRTKVPHMAHSSAATP